MHNKPTEELCNFNSVKQATEKYRNECTRCGKIAVTGRPHHIRTCKLKGPGDYLHDAILKWVGEGPTRQCGCQDRINQMNAWGSIGCREHLEEIVDWLMEEAAKRDWWKLTTLIPCSRVAVKQLLILPAIARAKEEEKKVMSQGTAL